MRPQRIVFYLFLCIALYLTTIAAVVFLPAASTPGGTPNGQLAEAVRLIVIPTACIAWISTAVTLVADRRTRRTMRELGYDEQIYKLMLQMRGAGSRLALLTSLRSPKHRSSLAQDTGLDWKEVDRQLDLLTKYGLAKVLAESGSIKIYALTEQGALLLDFLDESSSETLGPHSQ